MANGEEAPRLKLISGGSLREAELPVAGIALPAQAARSESPFVQGLRRLRKSTTALAFVVINLIVDLTYTFLDPRIRYS